MGRAYGLLYLSREPLGQAELQRRLGISVGSASMTLAALGRWGVVPQGLGAWTAPRALPGGDRLRKSISGVLNERERREIAAAVEVVAHAEETARAAQLALAGPSAPRRSKAEADFVVERVVRLGEICRLGETMLDMLLGQLTLDVGRFRNTFKVSSPLGTAPSAPIPERVQRRRR